MTVGETLTEARTQAGLSIDELSERTRIRGTVIRSIEQDDFEACGGDLYARGYVRAIAGAVGIDAQPLIREYDQEKAGQNERPNGSTGKHAVSLPRVSPPNVLPSAALPSAAPPPTAFDLPAVPEAPAGDVDPKVLGATRADLPVVSTDPAATAYDLPTVPETPRTAALPVLPPVSPTAEFPMAPPAPEAVGDHVPPFELAGTDSSTAIIPALGDDPAPAPPAEPDGQPRVQQTAAQPIGVQHDWVQPDWVPTDPAHSSTIDPNTAPPNTVSANTGPLQAGQFVPSQPGDVQPGRVRGSRRGLFAVAAIIVVIAIGVVGVRLATGGNTTAKNAAATTVPSSAAPSAASASAAARASASAQAKASASARASESARARKQAAAKAAKHVTTLSVASVAAYGPSGLGTGDNPGNAGDAIARHASTPWTSQWYVSPDFGMLKHGTGLLLNLGGKVTVSSVRLELSQFQGTGLQIRVGNSTTPQDLRVAAKANNVAGLVKLTLSQPTAARYLLIWFTQLPPDGAGHYRASVGNVVVSGQR